MNDSVVWRLADDARIALVTLNRPPLNLATQETFTTLVHCLDEAVATGVRCVIIGQGEARAFSAGSDMKEFKEVAADAPRRKILPEYYALRRLAGLPVPTIASIDGPALGGGLELALACDLRVATRASRFGLTETRIGGLGAAGAIRATDVIGPSHTKDLLYTGRIIDAETASVWGLVDRLVDSDADSAALALAQEISQNAPVSNRFAKEIVQSVVTLGQAQAMLLADERQEAIFRTNDLHRGAAAFLTKSPQPEFEGN